VFALPAPFTLRDIGADDQAFLDALYRSTRDDLAGIAAEPAVLAALIGHQQRMQSAGYRSMFPDAAYFVVERAGAPIGRLVVQAGPQHLHLIDIAIAAQARRQGAGRALVSALQAWAQARRLPVILNVAHSKPGAARLYADLGFVTTAQDALQQSMRWPA